MKIVSSTLLVLVILILLSCTKEKEREVDGNLLVEKSGISYMPNEKSPFSGKAVSYYENGKISLSLDYKDGKRDGNGVRYYENGKLLSNTKFIKGNYEGDNVSYYENGKIKSKESFSNGEIQNIVNYHENGQVSFKANFKNGEMHGDVISYYQNGEIEKKITLNEGKFSETLTLTEEEIERIKSGDGKKKTIDDTVITDNKEIYFKNGLWYKIGEEKPYTGLQCTYYPNGQVKEKTSLKNGKTHGKSYGYFENGKIQAEHSWENGAPVGEFITYNEKGEVVKSFDAGKFRELRNKLRNK